MVQPGLSFHGFSHRLGDLVHECSPIFSPCLSFGYHSIDCARGTTDLIGQRISLLARKGFRDGENSHGLRQSELVHVQLSKTLDHCHGLSIFDPRSSILDSVLHRSELVHLQISKTLDYCHDQSSILDPQSSILDLANLRQSELVHLQISKTPDPRMVYPSSILNPLSSILSRRNIQATKVPTLSTNRMAQIRTTFMMMKPYFP